MVGQSTIARAGQQELALKKIVAFQLQRSSEEAQAKPSHWETYNQLNTELL